MQCGKNVISQQLLKISGQLNYVPAWTITYYVLSNGGMSLAFHGQGHSIQIRETEK